MNHSQLLAKYDVPAPRYTSYPTVPYWESTPTQSEWLTALQKGLSQPEAGWSLYLHIPFCESLCTFCGCNTYITRNHHNELSYTEALHREWEHYLQAVPALADRPLKQIHLGGGTPTFYAPENLIALLKPILNRSTRSASDFEGSLEIGPRITSKAHLEAMRSLGFQRVSMGVQDYDSEVQRLINRIQPIEMTRQLTEDARELGYESVNYDLIYGLPGQTLETMQRAAAITINLRPDRIALYSFAFVPWVKKAHRLFTEEDLPQGAAKRDLYEVAREAFLEAGYIEMGLDHFALPDDSLAQAFEAGRLHRNFMGYTDQRTDVLLGLGVSAISEAPTCFHQNNKGLTEYKEPVLAGEIPTLRGHLLTEEDQVCREQILQFMTQLEVSLRPEQVDDVRHFLQPLLNDGLVTLAGHHLRLTEAGRPFLRNAAMALDVRLRRHKPDTQIFSQAV